MLLFSEDCQVNLSQPVSSLYLGLLATVTTVSICNSQAMIQDYKCIYKSGQLQIGLKTFKWCKEKKGEIALKAETKHSTRR